MVRGMVGEDGRDGISSPTAGDEVEGGGEEAIVAAGWFVRDCRGGKKEALDNACLTQRVESGSKSVRSFQTRYLRYLVDGMVVESSQSLALDVLTSRGPLIDKPRPHGERAGPLSRQLHCFLSKICIQLSTYTDRGGRISSDHIFR